MTMKFAVLGAALITALLSACSSNSFYENDGPPGFFQSSLNGDVAGAVPKVEPFAKAANRPYTVLGQQYVPMNSDLPLRQIGIASWYGKQFHGNKTSTGEVYDMFKATAAHPTMPLPSYAKVTNLENGRSIIVRVNDRGPFLQNRIIDLSYAAAKYLGYDTKGTAKVEVVRLTHNDIRTGITQSTSLQSSLDKNKDTPSSTAYLAEPAQGWGVQIGAFSSLSNAQQFASHAEAVLSSAGQPSYIRIIREGSRYRVVVQQGLSLESARLSAQNVKNVLGCNAFAVQR